MNHETATAYLAGTETAVKKRFEGIAEYTDLIKPPVFVTGSLPGTAEFEKRYAAWLEQNADALAKQKADAAKFKEQEFALSVLCGAVLHVADKAIELYSTNTHQPKEWTGLKPLHVRYCAGRMVRGIPLGLIVLAARNQHAHHGETLRAPSITIFERLCTSSGYRDPAFDLNNPRLISFAANVTALIKWRSFKNYDKDMRELLRLPSQVDAAQVVSQFVGKTN
ncbi:hypothetical protein [Pandoraea pnomenusa]|uniref:hypothetical protein n=1 Tax=Pandoraea pnomenusa TaxID=93220 RepID=UPI0011463616|nr:hypothetical protein [Pandoraea pnomenusa]QDH58332.1 hypothetical protein FKQ53_02845 [Pandoraea pnomenusa]